MQDLNDLLYFARVVEAGSFSAAAQQLGLPKSRVSRRVAELEARLGVRLLQRTTRKLSLTDVGERYFQHCQAMLTEAEAAEEAVAAVSVAPRGRLRVSCPVSLAQTELAPVLPAFLAAYPQVRLEMLLTNRRVDLLEEGVDVALRVRYSGDEDPGFVTRKLRRACSMLVAAPGLVASQPVSTPDDLYLLPTLGAIEADRCLHWRLTNASGETREIVTEPRLAIDDFVTRRTAAIAGLGVTMLPNNYCKQDVKNGRLVQVLPDWVKSTHHVLAVYPHRRGLLPAVRAFLDFVASAFDPFEDAID